MAKVKVRTKIINSLIENNSYSTYLEIGVGDKQHLYGIKVASKEGVDPNVNTTYRMTSDKFFSKVSKDKLYDIIFIDGLHLGEQALKDINNSLKHLSDGGTIIVHDCNPPLEEYATAKKTKTWWGTVWQAIIELRMSREDLSITVINADAGCGIIRPGKQKLFKRSDITYKLLEENRKELLNLISLEEFFNLKL